MDMKYRYWILGVFAVLMNASAYAADAPTKPNVVFILADDLGWGDVGWHGSEIKTPHLDKLANAGAKLEAFYVQPVCTPTRAALMTGRYPIRHGLQTGVVRPWAQYGLPLEEQTLAQGLKSADYATAIVGKWHLGHFEPGYLPTQRGFDHQYGHYNGAIDYNTHVRDGGFDWHKDDAANHDEGYSTHLIAKESTRIVETYAGKKPFFLYVPFNAVHSPHQVPEKYIKGYEHLKGERRTYAGMLTALDEAVGQIVEAVERAGVRDNTLFIFSSDNGGPQPGVVTSNGELRAGKATHYDGGVRVAAFATWDGKIPAGSTVKQPLHIADWYPTLLNLSGAKIDQKLPLDGRDAWPTIVQGKPSPRSDLLINATPHSGAIRAGDWKLVVNGSKAAAGFDGDAVVDDKSKLELELFNLAEDPNEKTNLADRFPDKVADLKNRFIFYQREAVAPKTRPKPEGFQSPKVWGEHASKSEKTVSVSDLKVGDKAPEFEAIDDTGKRWLSRDHVGKEPIVVYFYPADFTGGCTKQACAFRDDWSKFKEQGIQVVGVSGDAPESHRLFKLAHNLNFTLLADEEGKVAEAFGVPVTRGDREVKAVVDGKEHILRRSVSTKRWTFLIDKDGRIASKNTEVKPAEDSSAILTEVLGRIPSNPK